MRHEHKEFNNEYYHPVFDVLQIALEEKKNRFKFNFTQ